MPEDEGVGARRRGGDEVKAAHLQHPEAAAAGRPASRSCPIPWRRLANLGIKDIYILVGWKANKIKEYYGDGSRLGLRIKYLEQTRADGHRPCHRLRRGLHRGAVRLRQWRRDHLPGSDLQRMLDRHRATGSTVMGAVTVPDPERFGVIEASEDRLVKIHEKPKVPPTDLINAGAFVFSPEIFERIRATPQIGPWGVRDHRHLELPGPEAEVYDRAV